MPTWGIVIVLLLALPLIPGLEFLAIMELMVVAGMLLPIVNLANSVAAAAGISHLANWIAFGLIALLVALLAAPFVARLFRKDLSSHRRGRAINALVVILGAPIMIGLSGLRLAQVWVH